VGGRRGMIREGFGEKELVGGRGGRWDGLFCGDCIARICIYTVAVKSIWMV
jgi:hypothetical protein